MKKLAKNPSGYPERDPGETNGSRIGKESTDNKYGIHYQFKFEPITTLFDKLENLKFEQSVTECFYYEYLGYYKLDIGTPVLKLLPDAFIAVVLYAFMKTTQEDFQYQITTLNNLLDDIDSACLIKENQKNDLSELIKRIKEDKEDTGKFDKERLDFIKEFSAKAKGVVSNEAKDGKILHKAYGSMAQFLKCEYVLLESKDKAELQSHVFKHKDWVGPTLTFLQTSDDLYILCSRRKNQKLHPDWSSTAFDESVESESKRHYDRVFPKWIYQKYEMKPAMWQAHSPGAKSIQSTVSALFKSFKEVFGVLKKSDRDKSGMKNTDIENKIKPFTDSLSQASIILANTEKDPAKWKEYVRNWKEIDEKLGQTNSSTDKKEMECTRCNEAIDNEEYFQLGCSHYMHTNRCFKTQVEEILRVGNYKGLRCGKCKAGFDDDSAEHLDESMKKDAKKAFAESRKLNEQSVIKK